MMMMMMMMMMMTMTTTMILGPVSTWIGDRLWAGKPSRCVTGQLGQLSLPSPGVGKLSTGLSGWG